MERCANEKWGLGRGASQGAEPLLDIAKIQAAVSMWSRYYQVAEPVLGVLDLNCNLCELCDEACTRLANYFVLASRRWR